MPPGSWRPMEVSARTRAATALAVAGGVGAAATAAEPWQLAIVLGWIAAALVFLAMTWPAIARMDSAATARIAMREDNSRLASEATVLVACVASLVAVTAAVVHAAGEPGATKASFVVAGVVSVLLSWIVVHTVFTLRYAHLYYDAGGGIDFGGDAPDYRDFAYLAFTVGMTYQVSDTTITNRRIRVTVLGHGLVSFAFGTVIIAMTINIVAGLVR